jgi:hypothetical protein
MKNIYTPYTYLIGWSKLNKWYYGVRYAQKDRCLYETGCHPDDFWNTYFTSSEEVKEYLKLHGEPDVIQIRHKFASKEKAISWETKVLRRMNAVKDDKWLNRNDHAAPPHRLNADCSNTKLCLKGKDRTLAQRKSDLKRSERMKGKPSKKAQPITLFNQKYRTLTEAFKDLNIGYHHIEFLSNNKNIKSIDELKKLVYREKSRKLKNREISPEHLEKIKKAKEGKVYKTRKGQTNTKEHNKKVSEALKGKPAKIIKCPHCGKEGGANTMKRWHFDNCSVLARNI